jgi:hypothetical protein
MKLYFSLPFYLLCKRFARSGNNAAIDWFVRELCAHF